MIPDYDLYLFSKGCNLNIYEHLGAHIKTINGVSGVLFAVWAPNAKSVSVVGDFNNWDSSKHVMTRLGLSGVFEIFIPNIKEGTLYKYEIVTCKNEKKQKSDPYAFYTEVRPKTASRVFDIDKYKWKDNKWLEYRKKKEYRNRPILIYELHLGSWKKKINDDDDGFYTYKEYADMLVDYIKEMNYTHVELLPIAEHPFDGSWGYQVTGYYAVTSRYGNPDEFKYLVDKLHQNNIGIILDWVPGHFPKDDFALGRFDGTALYEHDDSRRGEHPHWGTYIFNFGRNEVKNFLIANVMFWLDKYHIDGIRVDGVASMLYLDYGKEEGEWLPNKWGGKENVDAIKMIREINIVVYEKYSDVLMIAEESTSWAMVSRPVYSGGLGFGYKWNMGWMNDFLKYMSTDPWFRKYEQDKLTFSIMYTYSENFILVLSHDEVVHGKKSLLSKMPGDQWQMFANLRLAYGFMYAHPGKKLMFMGGEFGQYIEWNYKHELDWFLLEYDTHKGMKKYVEELNKFYLDYPEMWENDYDINGFEWIDCDDKVNNVVSFVRRDSKGKELIFVCNFTPVIHDKYRIGIMKKGTYEEIFNSDDVKYGGSGVLNTVPITTEKIQYHNQKESIELKIPPLGMVILKRQTKKLK
jgi:1,4-alpha-glucan branching enzyme